MKVVRFLIAPASAALAAGLLAVPAHAATSVACTTPALIAAVNAANAGGGDTLNLAPGCTYHFAAADNADNALPVITTPITLNGSGATLVRDTTASSDFRLLNVGPTGNLTLDTLTVRGGHLTAAAQGGAGVLVQSSGRLSATSTTFTGNSANLDGGGIGNDGTATVTGSTFTSNAARHGAAVDSQGALTVTNSRMNNNDAASEAGAVNNDGGSTGAIVINNSQITNNTSGSDGGALDFDSGTITVNGGVISNNTVNNATGFAGGIYTDGQMTIDGATISGNTVKGISGAPDGGGIDNEDTLTVKRSAITDNTVTGANAQGGGIWNFGTLNLDDTTLRGNKATGTGAQAGGVYNRSGTVTASGSSILLNSSTTAPGGVWTASTFTLNNSAVVANQPTNCQGSPVIPAGCTN